MKRGHFGPCIPDHWLYPERLIRYKFYRASSYLERNFEGNQLLDVSIGLSPLRIALANDLHVNTAYRLPPEFPLASSRPWVDRHLSGLDPMTQSQPLQ